jgi:exosortase
MTPSPEQPSPPRAVPVGGASPGRSAPAGSLADMVEAAPAVGFLQSFPPATLVKIGVLGGLLVAAHYWQIDRLVRQWIGDPDWTHGFVIPLFSLYLLYSRRQELLAAERKTGLLGYLGLLIALLSLLAQPLCVYPIRNYWLMQICMVGVVFGLVLYLGGAAVIRLTWLPILFLLFAMPISPTLYTRISLPLQNFAAKGAMLIMRLLGVGIRAMASSLTLVTRSGMRQELRVAEACNGMKLLMAFLALGVAMAYLDDKPIWQRIVLVAAAIPIAILCNVIRVAITCWMFYIDRKELGERFMHYFTGVLMLVPAFLMLWGLARLLRALPRFFSWLVDKLFVEVSDEDDGDGAERPAQAGDAS